MEAIYYGDSETENNKTHSVLWVFPWSYPCCL